MAAVAGVAAFAGCKVDKVGTYTLTATASGLTSGVSSGFTITAGVATQLVFTAAPTTGASRAASATTGPFTLQLQDANGNAVVAGAGGVTVALTSTAPANGTPFFSATLNGTTAHLGQHPVRQLHGVLLLRLHQERQAGDLRDGQRSRRCAGGGRPDRAAERMAVT